MTINENTRALADNLFSVSSSWSADYQESVRHMLESLPALTIERIATLSAGHSNEVHDFLARMMIATHRGEGISKVTNASDVLIFAAGIAPVATCFNPMSPFSVDRWLYMSTVIAKLRGNTVSPDDLLAFHRGLALTLFVDQKSVNGRPESAHLVWLGAHWSKLEPLVPLLIERSSVEHSFVVSLIDGSNGLSTLSKGIL
jgi:hypothetical protein